MNYILLFLERSAYTEDDFKDYNESRYPWTKQHMSHSVDKINHVICGNELKADSTSFQNDVDGIHKSCYSATQTGCTVPDDSVTLTGPIDPVETGQDDITHTCTHSYCDVESNNNSKISCSDAVGMEKADRADPCQNDNKDFATDISAHVCDTLNNTELVAQDSSHPHAVTCSNMEQTDNSLVHQSRDQTSQNNTNSVNGLDSMVVQETRTALVCPRGGCELTCKPHSSCHFKGLPAGVGAEDTITSELTTTDDKIVQNGFKSEQGNSYCNCCDFISSLVYR